MPLERNTVRFIDNFSTGNRGAACAEKLLKKGYAVIFLHRANSAFPFARRLLPPALSAEDWLKANAEPDGDAAKKTAAAAAEYASHAHRFLALPFTSVDEYLHLLRAACVALAAAGPPAAGPGRAGALASGPLQVASEGRWPRAPGPGGFASPSPT